MDHTPLQTRLRAVRFLAMDVDGVLTEGGITWAADGRGELLELKTFNVRDGLGISLARAAGLEVGWITGRTSAIVAKRAAELGVAELCQWARNKRQALEELRERRGLEAEQVLFIGDDLNDLPALAAAGVRVAVADAAAEVRARADWVTAAAGGRGAVREVVETVLRAQGAWEAGVQVFLKRLEQEHARPAEQ